MRQKLRYKPTGNFFIIRRMTNIPTLKYSRRTIVISAALTLTMAFAQSVYALAPDFYAPNSRLAEGKWRRVKILKEGMQLITNDQLQKMGFANPEKVNVYGYGGRQLSDRLSASMPDDLPMQPALHTADGIIFYGAGTVSWQDGDIRGMKFQHSQNYYATDSYYYLSDIIASDASVTDALDCTRRTDNILDYFTETLLQEQELAHPGNSGSLMYGEDFRTTTSRPYKFTLTDAKDPKATLMVAFATNTSSNSSSISITANGKSLAEDSYDRLLAVTSADMMARYTQSIKEIENAGGELNIVVKYNPGGVVKMARLDFVRVNYNRLLNLAGGELAFRHSGSTGMVTYAISNADPTAEIWDVTDPAKPKRIKYTLEGTTAYFTPEDSGSYHEFIAFKPASVKLTTGQGEIVQNQDLHSMPVPDMVIISPDEYLSESNRLAQFHEAEDGFRVYVITPEQIYNEFSSGSSDVTAMRKMLKMWHDRGTDNSHSIRYCLLMGRPFYENRGLSEDAKRINYVRMPIWQAPTGLTSGSSYCTDDYIGMLEDNVKAHDMGSAKINVAVGRFPVKSAKEASTAVDKLIKYVKEPDYGDWRNRTMVIADDQDDGIHLTQAENCVSAMEHSDGGGDVMIEKLYLDSYPLVATGTGGTYPQASERLIRTLNDGVNFINYIGHGSPTQWGHESLWTYTQICNTDNKRLPIFLTATCEFGRLDSEATSAAEILWLNPDCGAISLLTAARLAYITQNGTFNQAFSSELYHRDSDGKGRRFGDVIVSGKNSVSGSDTNKLRYVLIGDPAMRVPLPEFLARVDRINDVEVGSDSETTLHARQTVKISGSVTDLDGNLLQDFNGKIFPKLYDAEKAVTTYGNGEEGKVLEFNDRSNLLFSGNVEVKNGLWEVNFVIPMEIENNYSPARMSLYAYSDKGEEAHGNFDDFYIFGYDENAVEDTQGPTISNLTLNSSSFREGDSVSPNSMVLANVFDESGINISQSGIGHQLSISVDGTKTYNDVSGSFTPDPADNRGGDIAYKLSGLEQGDHTLTLTVWDNAGNSSEASLKFRVSENAIPVLYDVLTDANPAVSSVTFTLVNDAPCGEAASRIEVFDLGGARIWAHENPSGTNNSITWDLTDGSGARVNRGIYLYRATVTTPDGTISTKTKKLAVAAK